MNVLSIVDLLWTLGIVTLIPMTPRVNRTLNTMSGL